jgi:hypothetical protein
MSNKGGKYMGLQPTERKRELRHYIYTKSGNEVLITAEEYDEIKGVYNAKDSSTRLWGVYVVKPNTDEENVIPMGSIDYIGKRMEEV